MCGICAYIGEGEVQDELLHGLQLLEYRGYDSAGIAVKNGKPEFDVVRKKGKVQKLAEIVKKRDPRGNIGIGHTRWATHGKPSEENAHPHKGENDKVVVVHNGIIENYAEIKRQLQGQGHTFHSQTDTEVLAHLLESEYERQGSLREAFLRISGALEGSFSVAAMSSDEDVILGARRGSPLLAGLGQNGNYLSSDRTPLFGKVDRLVNLRDDQMIILDEEDYEVVSMSSGEIISVDEEILPDDSETVEKKGYKHFMLKEIHEQPRVIRRILSKYVENEDVADLKIPKTFIDGLREGGRIILTACGSSWHAGLTAEYFLESSLDVPVEVEYASELRYRDPVIRENDLVIGISQSGQTADTIGALEEVIKRGANVLGVINTPRSSIDELVNEQVDEGESATLYVEAGQEIGVASTKAYTAQLMVLNMLNLYLGRELGTISEEERKASIDEARKLPSYMEEILAFDDDIREIAEEYEWEEGGNALFMGRNINFPTALEGALKLKEISYVHAEGYPAAEMKHGPIALVDENMPCFFIAGEGNGIYQKVLSNMQEVKARDSGSVLAIADHDDPELYNNADRVIEVSKTRMEYSPILNVVPLQLFSYHVADLMDRDVDQPRNLAKSVTVE